MVLQRRLGVTAGLGFVTVLKIWQGQALQVPL